MTQPIEGFLDGVRRSVLALESGARRDAQPLVPGARLVRGIIIAATANQTHTVGAYSDAGVVVSRHINVTAHPRATFEVGAGVWLYFDGFNREPIIFAGGGAGGDDCGGCGNSILDWGTVGE